MTQEILTAKEVSELIRIKPARVWELIRQRKIPFILLGQRQYRFSKSAIEKWLENGGNLKEGEQDAAN